MSGENRVEVEDPLDHLRETNEKASLTLGEKWREHVAKTAQEASTETPEPTSTVEPTPTAEPTPEPTPTTPELTPRIEPTPVTEPTREPTPVTPETTPTAEPTPEPTPTTPEPTPRTPEELQERLNDARREYLEAKKAYTDSKGIMSWLKNRNQTAATTEALERAEAEFKRAFAEYVGIESSKLMAEMTKTEEETLRMLNPDSQENIIIKAYKYLGESSILGVDVKSGNRLKNFAFNNRTLISGALLATSVAFGPAGWVGAGAVFTARRIFGGLGAGVAVQELAKNARRANVMKDMSTAESATTTEYQDVIMAMRARATLDGTLDKLATSPEYIQALEARNSKIESEYSTYSDEAKARAVEGYIDYLNTRLDGAILNEKKWNKKAKLMGVAAGLFVGSGAAAELIKGLGGKTMDMVRGWWSAPGAGEASVEAAQTVTETVKPPMTVESDMRGHNEYSPITEQAQEQAYTNIVESGTQETTLTVGSRGIEGTLLDLKDSNPTLYQTMIENLKGQDPNFKGDDGGLIHRFAERFAEANELNIDEGGGKDLSKIFSGEITIAADGEVSIKNYELMPDSAPAVDNSVEITPEADSETPIELQNMDTDSTPETTKPIPEPLNVGPTTNYQEILNATPSAEISPAPEAPTVEDSGTSESTEAKTAEEAAREAKVLEALNLEKNSDVLKALISKDEYSQFLKDYSLSEKNLNALPQDMNIEQFMAKLGTDEKFAEKYAAFAKKIAQVTRELGGQLLGADNLRELIVILADDKIK